MSTISFDGRVAIVTGGAGILGSAYVRELARRGAAVVISDIGKDEDGRPHAERLSEEIERDGGRVAACLESLTDERGPERIYEFALERFGRIDALINSAGFSLAGSVEEYGIDDFRQMAEVHLRGPFLLSQLAYRAMVEQGYGRIVSMASSAGMFGLERSVGYAMFKTAVVGFTNAVSLEAVGTGVCVNAVLPRAPTGRTKASRTRETLAHALHRLEPEYVAPLVAYLASEACTRSHRLYSAAAGCYAEVFTGMTRGWFSPGPDPPTADDIATHYSLIADEQDHTVPRSIPEETAAIVAEIAEQRRTPRRLARSSRVEQGSLRERVVVVTGAGHGLGRAFALDLASLGARVVVNDVGVDGGSRSTANDVVDEIQALGGSALAVAESVARPAGADAIVAAAMEHFGRLDGLVNNAGLIAGGAFEDETVADLDRLLDVHAFGAFLCARAALPHFRENGYGRIVNVSSSAGVFGIADRPIYAATKMSVVGLTNVLAIEYAGQGILANTLLPRARVGRKLPAASRGDLIPPDIEERIRPEFVAPLVSYLVSPHCTTARGVYSAGAGWYGRAFAALGRGWVSPGLEPPRAEEIDAHLSEIEELGGYTIPEHVDDETAAVVRRLAEAGIGAT